MGPIDDAFERAPCGLVTTTVDGMIVRVNSTFCCWVGYAAGELLEQRRIQDLLSIGGKVFHQTHWAPLLQMQRSVAEVKLELCHRDGHKVPMLINAVRRHDGETEYDHFAFVIVTDRDKYEKELLATRQRVEIALEAKNHAEQALQLADRRKDEFLATLAHELRNPLAPIQTVVELLRTKHFDDDQVIWSRGVLERQVGHIARLVDDLLEVSRVAEGKLELRKERIELNEAIRQALESSRGVIEASSHRLIVEVPPEPIFLDADPVRLSQIIQNLINNAAKYTPAGGTITLSAIRDADEAVICVRDTGIGIAAEHLPTIFGIFAQLAPGLSRSQGGLGIGLSLVRSLTERHGGTVSASSGGVGRGSEFVVRLPVAAVAPASSSQAAMDDSNPSVEAAPACESWRIMIIDDSVDAAVSLAMLLDLDGHATRIAYDGAGALQLIAQAPSDVILLDIGLPDINGYDLAKQIRERPDGDHILLIALTGWSQEQDKQDAAAAGFDMHFTKPVDYRRLLAVLNEFRAI
ncbi:Sensor histidine kinase RcsC [Caballeronia sp. SBC1]|uniref:hybrid sensor histidine kinase/response regulator n=1 Tax=unclassified Caballeronia TaxID=2646786 RepID=UPI0013E0F9EF|nr:MULTISPECIES: ATP-binding protein [unclassified Caballeronia]QIE23677.1 Sensor histidine kinase RcsC [Caballeronia sp. SBC2]QIN61569.1 Sensor histidine kinase RcsC [Caballeronia sp. SBC1]